MKIEKFRSTWSAPDVTKTQLVEVLGRARERQLGEHVAFLEALLDARFPDWHQVPAIAGLRSGGRKAVTVRYDKETLDFRTSIEGYIWLLEKFVCHKPDAFRRDRRDLLRYLASSPHVLFYLDEERERDPDCYVRLSNGWCVNKSVSNEVKFHVLTIAGAVADLRFPSDWDWQSERPSMGLVKKREFVARHPVLPDEYPFESPAEYGLDWHPLPD